ncbi:MULTISPECIES: OprD family outer membrane porin [unclassified Acinetobacter]|uniref:OprD family outer membrane porin n=1 Tax=unclassified Acinetobacter TaxID=196816 RepID=UPI002934B93B|nr:MULTISPECIES: OprD family outer membrane porin [unclassified Acinetobacter]WOE32958.1 OprD family outer membrane porin [Acinetobacter sp. SAAs470]WOE38435.1 OprD family outer membrane porin [Acinetobacter sp. SAAs474]
MQKSVNKNLLVMGSLCLFITNINIAQANFIDDTVFNVLAKNYYFNRDFRKGEYNSAGQNAQLPVSERKGYREEWAQGFIVNLDSGWTDTPVQFGLNTYALMALKLDSDGYRTGTNNLEVDSNGKPKSATAEFGGAVRAKYHKTEVLLGNQFPNNPIIGTNYSRLLPSMSTGLSIKDHSFDHLTLNFGYFTQMSPVDSTERISYFNTDYNNSIQGKYVTYLGVNYNLKNIETSLYVSELDNVWMQYYLGAKYNHLINDQSSFNLQTNNYLNRDTGEATGGNINTGLISLTGNYKRSHHSFSLAYQQVLGDEPFDWIGFKNNGGIASIPNSVQFSTFTEAKEKSAQIKYEIDFSSYGAEGLSFMTRYIYGWDMDNTASNNIFYTERHIYNQDTDNKHWERDIELRYKIKKGFAKNLDIRIRQATHRATQGYRYGNIDEIRLILEYPFSF